MKKSFKITALFLALLMTLAACLTSCSSPKYDSELEIKVMALNGTTGFGMASLINDSKDGKTALNYNISVESDASNILAALINKSVDIAALPTNAAAKVYKKSNGNVQVLALNTLGVLYLLENNEAGATVSSFEDLRGKTVYVPAENPTYIFSYLCEQNGLEVGKDVTIDNTYAQPADLRAAAVLGKVEFAVLPEPMVTIAQNANNSLKVALDLTDEWDDLEGDSSLVQGCVVVRKDFAQAHPQEVAKFLEEYKASIEFLSKDYAVAAQTIVDAGIASGAPVITKAIPKCNVCFITGNEMKTALSGYLSSMFSVDPMSVGGSLPTNDFYYIAK